MSNRRVTVTTSPLDDLKDREEDLTSLIKTERKRMYAYESQGDFKAAECSYKCLQIMWAEREDIRQEIKLHRKIREPPIEILLAIY